jgi:hypothetical protein
METIFWNKHGEMLVDCTPRGAAINVGRYHSTLTDTKELVCCQRGCCCFTVLSDLTFFTLQRNGKGKLRPILCIPLI